MPAPCNYSFSYEARTVIVIHPLSLARARRIFHCTLSASLSREIDSSVIGGYGGEAGEGGGEGAR